MIFDNHSHTEFSSDSDMKIDAALKKIEDLGIGLVLTEHYDVDYKESIHYKDMDFLFDAREYWQVYEEFRGDSLLLGVEVGLTEKSGEKNQEFLTQVPFDLVIGSIHAINKMDIYYPDFYHGKTKEQAYREYLRQIKDMISLHPYIDVLGHVDYMARYAPYEDKEFYLGEFQAELEEIFQGVLGRDIILELNTRRLNNEKTLKALGDIYRLYKEMGGKYISLGSDAHSPENIGGNFKMALELIEALSLRPVTFIERRMQFCKY